MADGQQIPVDVRSEAKASFESYAADHSLDLTPGMGGYLVNETAHAWRIWRAAFAAGERAPQHERAAA